ncbi:uncharacterized protein LOC110841623 isoform X5 [Folsomia candida]|uniref:uncharacterized protein LOC110841623 isoform X5 n=1 Tax=Folsomia candida TaxID=158441 RepID=UPI000B8FAEA8|nr:uncharacterized protein LOC110841623 isoform X5 [Folsomia candida]
METSGVIDKDCPFGALFQQIINEMKNCAPLWEDLTARSTKLHSCLRATLQAISSFLDTLQKIADAATATKGATKDIGTALTRICLRHKALEAKMKTFTSSLMDCLVLPLQDKMEDWKKSTVQLDKDHAKEYKRARTELKKRSIETIRLQKKLRKGSSHNGGSFTGTLPRSGGSNGSDTGSLHGGNQLNRILEVALRDNADKRQAFEDAEKVAIRNALLEERSRFALFVSYLKPVVDEEVGMLFELTHVQEAMQMLEKHSADPFTLPPASEQVIADLKGSCDSGAWSFQTPPSSPSSLGSRKSSMCSISSANSSSSGSAHSPSHKAHNRTIHHPPVMIPGQVGTLRYSSVSSQDSGFTSQDTLFSRYTSFFPQHNKPGNQSEGSNTSSTASSNSSTPSSPYPPGNTALTTWPNLEDSMQFERAACAIMNERPHTISSAYERGHQRPPLTVYTFQPPNPNDANHQESPSTPVVTPVILDSQSHSLGGGIYQSASEIYGILRGKSIDAKPPVPKRCSSLERPQSAAGGGQIPKPLPKNSKSKEAKKQQQRQEEKDNINKIYASNVPDFNQSAEDMIVPQPMYVNMHDLTQMAKEKRQRQEMDLPPPPPELMANKVDGGGRNGDGGLSSGYGSQVGGQFEDTMHLKQQQTPVYGYTGGQEGDQFGSVPASRSKPSRRPPNSFVLRGSDPLYDIPEGSRGDGVEELEPSDLNDQFNNNNNFNSNCSSDSRSADVSNLAQGSGIAYLRQNRNRHSLQHSMSFDSSFMNSGHGFVGCSNTDTNLNGRTFFGSCGPESLEAELHDRRHNPTAPYVPVLDGRALFHNAGSGGEGCGDSTQQQQQQYHNYNNNMLHRNNSLPRPHSIAAPAHSTFMQYRLVAKKRDFV